MSAATGRLPAGRHVAGRGAVPAAPPDPWLPLVLAPDLPGQYLIEASGFRGGALRVERVTASGRAVAGRHGAGRTVPLGQAVSEITFRWSDREWTGEPDDPDMPHLSYDGRAAVPFRLARALPIEPEDSPRIARQLGEIELINADGGLDRAVDEVAVDARPVRVLFGPRGGRRRDFEPVLDGLAEKWERDDALVRLHVRDRRYGLDRRLQQDLYAGSGGVEGGEAAAGRPKPLLWGRCLNVRPVPIDPALLVWQVSVGPILAVDAVYDRAAALAHDADYPDWDALAAATVPAGSYATCLTLGLIRLGAPPDGLVTADARGRIVAGLGYVDTVDTVARAILRVDAAVPAARIDAGSWAQLAGLGGEIGWHVSADEAPSVEETLDAIVRRAGGYWGTDRRGRLRAGRLVPPEARTPSFRFDAASALAFRLIETRKARWRERVGYARNWTLQRGEDIAAGVDQLRKQRIAQESEIATAADIDVRVRHPDAIDGLLPALFTGAGPATALAERLVALHGRDRGLWQLDLPRSAHALDLGMVISVTWPRLAPAGRTLVVVCIDEDTAMDGAGLPVGVVTLWG